MARDDERQAMSDERLAEIAQFVFDLSMIGELGEHNVEHDYLRDLLAEVERLRARETALVAVLRQVVRDADATYIDVRPYAGIGHTKLVGPFPDTLEQARALLASADGERSGGDGA